MRPRARDDSSQLPSPDPTPIESAIVARVREGDPHAFEILFRRHYEQLYQFAYHCLGQREPAEELVQDIFTRIWERRQEWVVAGTVRSYLYGAVHKGVLSLRRHGRVVRAHESTVLNEVKDAADALSPRAATPPDREVEQAELGRALDEAIARLPERTRQAFVLQRQYNLTYPEIAAVMEISVKGVEYHIGAALKTLRSQLAPFFTAVLILVSRGH